MKLKEIKRAIKGVFLLPKKRYYLGKLRFGTPYFNPFNFQPLIIKVYKTLPMVQRCKRIRLFNRYIFYGWPIKIVWFGLGWKDKFDTPRYEWSPTFQIYFFLWQFCITWNSPLENGIDYRLGNDQYYEQVLWFIHYSDYDIDKARETWGWVSDETKKSTWKDEFLIQ